MFKKNLLFILSGLVATLTLVSCGDDDTTNPGDGRKKVTVTDTLFGESGTLTDVTVAPESGNTIYLKGYYIVNRSSTLTIPAGTKIVGLPETIGNQPAALITESGDGTAASGQLFAEGTASAPIVFTSSLAAGSRGRGNWGGVVLLGNAENNLLSKIGTIEGTGGNYGPVGTAKNDDNSGTLRYVRIEYGGTKVSPDNEINGLTMGSVGSGTTLEYIQSHMIADDGFEWFGGTVNGKYLVSSGNDDDGFDMDFGYHGNLQFLFVMQDPDLANRGFEIDNDGDGSANTPITGATVANVTIVGTGKDKANSEDNDGFYLRRNNQLKIWNAISTNFRYAMVVDGAATGDNVQNNNLYVKQSILNGRTGAYLAKGSAADYAAKAATWGNIEEDPQLVGIDFTNPQPKPTNSKAANVGSVPSNGFFTANTFAGAFDPSSNTYWFSGWTNWVKS
ncbi:MAG: hypothetical protein KDD67_01365 [Ignavibacteriae bacterium]|nr:hypothetical protein [Ignavibacteriota bacterium]MCB9216532.1 hypothetical protein [Ignavibacteria bacterium]